MESTTRWIGHTVSGLCYLTDRPLEAIQYLEQLDGVEFDQRLEKLFYLVRSHVDWKIGRDSDARNDLIHYLGMEETEIRKHEAVSGNEVEEFLL